MTISVLDTAAALEAVAVAPADERRALLAEMLEPMRGAFRHQAGDLAEVDLVAAFEFGGFGLDIDAARLQGALAAMRGADMWARAERAAVAALAEQRAALPDARVPDAIRVLIVPGNPDDPHFMDEVLGLVGMGGISGYIWITVWPGPENLERIEASVVHELHHNLRYTNVVWNPQTVTVGEHVISEGLADAFARARYGELGYARIGTAHLHDDDVYDRVVAGFGETGMAALTPYVLGDATAVRMGAEPVGVPTGGGYAVGNRIVDAYLARTWRGIDDLLLTDAWEIIRTVEPRAVAPT